MPGTLVHLNAMVQCPHQAPAMLIPSAPRVFVSMQPVATTSDRYAIAGCIFMQGPKASPCLSITWLVPALRVTSNNKPLVLFDSKGLCNGPGEVPQGAPLVKVTQQRVKAI